VAGVLSLTSFICFRQIQADEAPERQGDQFRPEIVKRFHDVLGVVLRDGRCRRYLLGCLVDGFCQKLYFPLIWALPVTMRLDRTPLDRSVHTVPL